MCLIVADFITPISRVVILPDGTLPVPKEKEAVYGGFIEFYKFDGEFYELIVEQELDVIRYRVVKLRCENGKLVGEGEFKIKDLPPKVRETVKKVLAYWGIDNV